MNMKGFALIAALVLGILPALVACGTESGGSASSEGVQSQASTSGSGVAISDGAVASDSSASASADQAPILDGQWRQVGHGEDEGGMVGAIDGDMIALWIRADGEDWMYWCGTFEAPASDAPYAFVSKADKGNMTGLLTSQDDSKEFSYADGKLTFLFSIQGDTTEVVIEQVSEEAGLLADLKSDEGKFVDRNDADIQDLLLTDTCYSVDDGYVNYAIAINNPNEEYAPQSVNVSIVGRAEDGSISFSDDWIVGTTLPGGTTYWASQAGNGNVAGSDTIEISVSVNDNEWIRTSQKDNFYQIENVNMSEDSFGYPIATGEITLKENVDLQGFANAKSPMFVCILRDSDGKMVGGFTSFSNKELVVGETTPFEIDSLGGHIMDYASADVYANPW